MVVVVICKHMEEEVMVKVVVVICSNRVEFLGGDTMAGMTCSKLVVEEMNKRKACHH